MGLLGRGCRRLLEVGLGCDFYDEGTSVGEYIPALLMRMSMGVSAINVLNARMDSLDDMSKIEVFAPSAWSCLSLGPLVRDVAYVVYPWFKNVRTPYARK